MKKATIVVDVFYQNNRLFDIEDKKVNRDNCLYFFYALKAELYKKNIDLSTQDINPIEQSDIVIYNEMPKTLPKQDAISKSYLLLFESEIIRSDNWENDKHGFFYKIFTWNDDFVDNKKYFKMNFSHKIPNNYKTTNEDSKLFCAMVAGNKNNNDPRELYSERKKAIKWFSKSHLLEFDLYGTGWDCEKFKFEKPFKLLNNFKFLRKIFKKKYISYKGIINSKYETLSKYKFSICYENAQGITGYVTEKIFDCFFAGCIPIYWGAPNITEFIPQSCFIDKTKFKTYEELYNYLINMPDDEYTNYLSEIEKFINSEQILLFSAEYNADKIAHELTNYL